MTRPTEPSTGNGRDDGQGKHQRAAAVQEQSDLGCHREHLLPSETEILERFGCLAVERRGAALVAAAGGEIALGDPRGRAVRGG